MSKRAVLEICCNSAVSAVAAFKGGADRIELCENLELGGTTPSFATIKITRELIPIPIHVLIRPRPGDFLYSDTEFKIILEEISMLKDSGIQGIVIGFLNPDYTIDYRKVEKVKNIAGNLSITFHRAFDFVSSAEESINNLIDLGIDRILTSGGKSVAYQAIDKIRSWVNLAGNRISIMPGSGINQNNIVDLYLGTGAKEFHASCKKKIKSKMHEGHLLLSMGSEHADDSHDFLETDPEAVALLAEKLKFLSTNR